MRMIRDPKGRFPERPYYTNDELDRECERHVRDLHRKRNQEARPRITTDELHLLIELNDAGLGSSADLTVYDDDVEGVAAFHPDGDTKVAISARQANEVRTRGGVGTSVPSRQDLGGRRIQKK